MEWWHIYLFTRLDVIQSFLAGCWIILLVFAVVVGISHIICIEQLEKHKAPLKKARFIVLGLTFLLSLLYLSLPTQKEFAAIYLIPKLIQAQGTKDFIKEAEHIPTDAVKLLRLKLEDYINDVQKEKNK